MCDVECDKLKNVANVEAGKEKKTKANKHYPGSVENSSRDGAQKKQRVL